MRIGPVGWVVIVIVALVLLPRLVDMLLPIVVICGVIWLVLWIANGRRCASCGHKHCRH